MTSFERPTDRADELRATPERVRFLEIPEHRFVMVDGNGPPGGESFTLRLPGSIPSPTNVAPVSLAK